MHKPIIITLLLVLSSLFIKAQDKAHFQPDSMIKVIPDGRHALFTINGKLQSPDDIRFKLLSYAPSAAEYNMTKNNLTWAFISTGGFAVSSVASTIEFAHNNKNAGVTTGIVNGSPGFIYQHHSYTGAYIFTGIATAFAVTAIINFVKAAKHSQRALKLYNQQFE
jgi:hypothetical protein